MGTVTTSAAPLAGSSHVHTYTQGTNLTSGSSLASGEFVEEKESSGGIGAKIKGAIKKLTGSGHSNEDKIIEKHEERHEVKHRKFINYTITYQIIV